MSLWVCSEDHEEICHETFTCPFCTAIGEQVRDTSDLESKILELEKIVAKLEETKDEQ